MSFLSDIGDLGSQLLTSVNEQFSAGENRTRSLDTDPDDPDKVVYFGKLGDFAKKIDNTAQRSYVESGYIRNVRPRTLDVLMQEPTITVCVKKRMFSSLANNFRLDLASDEEKLFIRSAKRLFQNKCSAIAIYEKLSKMEKIIVNRGVLDEFMFPQIMSGVDALEALGVDIIDAKTKTILSTLRKLNMFSEPSSFTEWILDRDTPFASEFGDGTGVMELTTLTTMSSNVSTQFGGGSATLSFEDPYKLMVVNDLDIEKAISDASSPFKQINFFRVAQQELARITDDLKQQLNGVRAERNVSLIDFIVSPDTLLFKRVRAVIAEEGREIVFNYDPGFLGIGGSVSLDDSAYGGSSGVARGSEENLLKTIIKNLFEILAQDETTKELIKDFNKREDIKYVRDKMRLHFGNKAIIQPMDVVHIFISSKTVIDDKVTGFIRDSLSGQSILSTLDNTFKNLRTSFNDLSSFFGGNKNTSDVEVEKDLVVGPEFPTWLYTLLRNDFTRQAAGTHIFAGIVSDPVAQSYSAGSGAYNIRVSVKDNAAYFGLSNINIDPSVDVYNSTIYDPLSPFKSEFNLATGFQRGEFPSLLDENRKILQSSMLVFKNGPFRGSKATEILYKAQNGERIISGNLLNNFRTVLSDPDGFVYRWKSGIEALTYLGEPHPRSSTALETAPKLTTNPFAGQDAMNVLSLLITGQPYNYNNFVKSALASGNFTRDDLVNGSGNRSYYKGLISQLTEQNSIWGNFVPFKKMVVSDAAYSFLTSGQTDLTFSNQTINALQEERARLFDDLVNSPDGRVFANNPRAASSLGLSVAAIQPSDVGSASPQSQAAEVALQIYELDSQIAQQAQYVYDRIKNSNLNDGSIKIFGDDITQDASFTESGSPGEAGRQRDALNFRKKLYNLTQRRLWKVKANEDINLFIVDDQYDKNYDLQSFEKSLSGKLNLFNSQYGKIDDQIKSVSDLLMLEVFADTQGNIQARPPAYNRVPSSVFRRMMRDKERKGVRVFPKILEDLFVSQIDGLVDRLEIVEGEIRLRAAALGYSTDQDAARFLNGSQISHHNQFAFITDPNNMSFGGSDLKTLVQQAQPEDQADTFTQPLTEITSKIAAQLQAESLFDTIAKSRALNLTEIFSPLTNDARNRYLQVKTRLEKLKNVVEPTLQELISNDKPGQIQQTDILKLLNDISASIAERQEVLKLLSNAVKNLNDGVAIEKDPNVAKAVLYPTLYGDTYIPDLISHMIEDEDYDDLGPGSGARYVIKDNQIKEFSIEEKGPDYTIVEVNGLFGDKLVAPPGQLEIGDGGNTVATAFAVDYDLWQMYGFRTAQTVKAPFFSEPDAQCSPYAVFLLNLARKRIFSATITIIGNEYMQPGEVVYIEDRDLLFYIESVSHNYTEATDFSTSLRLTYGHNPGEYIPTHLDLVGKALYAQKGAANFVRHQRQGYASGESPLGVIALDNNSTGTLFYSDSQSSSLLSGTFSESNKKTLTKILFTLAGGLTIDAGVQPKIEFRIYYNESAGFSPSNNLESLANAAIEWLKNPTQQSQEGEGSLIVPADIPTGFTNDLSDLVEITLVEAGSSKSPSSQAWSLAHTILKSGGAPSDSSSATLNGIIKEETVIFSQIVDIWVRFDNVNSTDETTRSDSSITSQAQVDSQQLIDQLYFGKLK